MSAPFIQISFPSPLFILCPFVLLSRVEPLGSPPLPKTLAVAIVAMEAIENDLGRLEKVNAFPSLFHTDTHAAGTDESRV